MCKISDLHKGDHFKVSPSGHVFVLIGFDSSRKCYTYYDLQKPHILKICQWNKRVLPYD